MKTKELRVLDKVNKRNRIRKSKLSVKRANVSFVKRGQTIEQVEQRPVKLVLRVPMVVNLSDRHAVYGPKRHRISPRVQQRAKIKRNNSKNK